MHHKGKGYQKTGWVYRKRNGISWVPPNIKLTYFGGLNKDQEVKGALGKVVYKRNYHLMVREKKEEAQWNDE